jgi:hypothetical protein
MKTQQPADTWIVLDERGAPPDLSRENAAFEREREHLLRDHRGKIALIRGDEVVGVFDTLDEALIEGYRRFGMARMLFAEITERDESEFIPHVDINHPSFRRLA